MIDHLIQRRGRTQGPLATARLLIRSFAEADLAAFQAYRLRPEVYRYLFRPPPTAAALAEQLGRIRRERFEADGDALHAAVALKDGGAVIGDIMLKLADAAAMQAEIGYIFDPAHGGRGYASEALPAALDLAFAHLPIHRLFARVDPRNLASVRLLEGLGFRREAHFIQNDRFDGVWGDEFVYAMLKSEWQARRPADI